MCRRNQLWGCCSCALGLGVLVGSGMESGLLCLSLGIGLLLAGLSLFRRR